MTRPSAIKKRVTLTLFIIPVFTYIYPRTIVHFLGIENPWTNYLYHYGFGAVFFVLGIWIIRANRSCVPRRGRDGFWYKFLIFGFFAFLFGHALWIYLALNVPYLGGA